MTLNNASGLYNNLTKNNWRCKEV